MKDFIVRLAIQGQDSENEQDIRQIVNDSLTAIGRGGGVIEVFEDGIARDVAPGEVMVTPGDILGL